MSRPVRAAAAVRSAFPAAAFAALCAALLGLSAIALVARVAHAQEVITTDRAASAPRPAANDAGPIATETEVVEEVDHSNPCGPGPNLQPVKRDANGEVVPDRSAHGEVGASVGTRGYHEVHGVVCQPIGARGAVIIGVSQSSFGRR